MSMAPLHDNVALAIDGGGIKGLIIARALIALENELGGKPLIEHPAIKILAGTSTGSVITAGIALGMKAAEIADLYLKLGQHVFPPLVPPELPKVLRDGAEAILMIAKTSLYSNEQAIEFLKNGIASKTGNPDFTLAELNDRLGPHKSLIMTVVNINERRTHFIKSYKQDYGNWKLWEAIMASSSAPVALPVFPHLDPRESRPITPTAVSGVTATRLISPRGKPLNFKATRQVKSAC
jgi:patatin-like phospholipase/acyl hydrolase